MLNLPISHIEKKYMESLILMTSNTSKVFGLRANKVNPLNTSHKNDKGIFKNDVASFLHLTIAHTLTLVV